MSTQGQDPGHPSPTWAQLVHAWRDRAGGWVPLAEELLRRGGGRSELPDNLETIERGLRRLAARGHASGGQYGRWLERFFGTPPEIEGWLRWLGQYHSRFADLPVSLRRRQLEHWDQPPLNEAAAGVWLDLGMASVGFRLDDEAVLGARLDRARRKLDRASAAARLEHALLRARVDDPDGAWLDAAAAGLDDPALGVEDAACYRARHVDATAYRRMREGASFAEGRALYASIPADTAIPFVDFRRALGLAYCDWKAGDVDAGLRAALAAADHAGDGGYVRLRAMAFNLASRIATGDRAAELADRARVLSERLEDEELRARVERPR
ncbi:MAG: hypothetical protein H6719_27445 [Sandaracinaceae bacterium]|nr:hypothetical protein [Sandaracinaceae bacterium]